MKIHRNKPAFPCNSCGGCCRKVANSKETAWLDRGDSVCKHFDEETNLCLIYESRPLVCQIENYYDEHLSEKFSWTEFIQINLNICEKLQQQPIANIQKQI